MGAYPRISVRRWEDRIQRWNNHGPTGNLPMRKDAAERCRRNGHDYRESPVGLWCYVCCQYFYREGE